MALRAPRCAAPPASRQALPAARTPQTKPLPLPLRPRPARHLYPDLASPRPRASQEVADLIAQCMALDPGDRPSAQQLLARLEELAALRPPAGAAAATASSPGVATPRAEEAAALARSGA